MNRRDFIKAASGLLLPAAAYAQFPIHTTSFQTSGAAPPAFPAVNFGPDEFAGTAGDSLSTYSANYTGIAGVTQPIIDAASGARSNAGSAFRAARLTTAPTQDHLDIVIGINADISSDTRYGGVSFFLDDHTSSTATGFMLQIIRVGAGDTRGRLINFTSGAPGTTLDETTGLNVLNTDRVGVRVNADGTWQMYTSNNNGAWATTGTPGDLGTPSAGGAWVISESSVVVVDYFSWGSW